MSSNLIEVNVVKIFTKKDPISKKKWINSSYILEISSIDVPGMKDCGWQFGKYDELYEVTFHPNSFFYVDKDSFLKLTHN